MRDPKPEKKPTTRLFVETALRVRHRYRISGVDVGDAGCHDQGRGAGKQPSRIDEDVATSTFRRPQDFEAAFLHALRERQSVRRAQAIEACPDAKLAELHATFPLGTIARTARDLS